MSMVIRYASMVDILLIGNDEGHEKLLGFKGTNSIPLGYTHVLLNKSWRNTTDWSERLWLETVI